MTSFSYDTVDRMPYFIDPKIGGVKLGTECVVTRDGKLNYRVLDRKIREVAAAYERGIRIFVVTSGAIASGIEDSTPSISLRGMATRTKKVAAGVGQPRLMGYYGTEFGKYGHKVMQVLVSSRDFKDREAVEEIRETCIDAMDNGIVPIVNANDTISKKDIERYDNDLNSAATAILLYGDFLIGYLAGKRNGHGDVEGFYDGDPDNPKSRLIKAVYEVTEEVERFAVEKGGLIITRGGFQTKNQGGKILIRANIPYVVTNEKYFIEEILGGEDRGTIYVSRKVKHTSDMDKDEAFELIQELFSEVERTA